MYVYMYACMHACMYLYTCMFMPNVIQAGYCPMTACFLFGIGIHSCMWWYYFTELSLPKITLCQNLEFKTHLLLKIVLKLNHNLNRLISLTRAIPHTITLSIYYYCHSITNITSITAIRWVQLLQMSHNNNLLPGNHQVASM